MAAARRSSSSQKRSSSSRRRTPPPTSSRCPVLACDPVVDLVTGTASGVSLSVVASTAELAGAVAGLPPSVRPILVLRGATTSSSSKALASAALAVVSGVPAASTGVAAGEAASCAGAGFAAVSKAASVPAVSVVTSTSAPEKHDVVVPGVSASLVASIDKLGGVTLVLLGPDASAARDVFPSLVSLVAGVDTAALDPSVPVRPWAGAQFQGKRRRPALAAEETVENGLECVMRVIDRSNQMIGKDSLFRDGAWVVNASIDQLVEYQFSDESVGYWYLRRRNGDTEVFVEPWDPVPDAVAAKSAAGTKLGESLRAGPLLSRMAAFIQHNEDSRIGPPTTKVVQRHYLQRYHSTAPQRVPNELHFQYVTDEIAPMLAGRFRIVSHYHFAEVYGTGTCRLRVSMQIVWIKTTLAKRVVEGAILPRAVAKLGEMAQMLCDRPGYEDYDPCV